MAAGGGRSPSTASGGRPAIPKGVLAAGLGLVLVLVVGLAILLLRDDRVSTGNDVQVEVAGRTTTTPKPSSATERPASPPERVRITFDSTPQGAGVFLPGKDRRIGVTPFSVQVQPSASAQDFEFRLDGYEVRRETMQPPTGDTRLHVELVKK